MLTHSLAGAMGIAFEAISELAYEMETLFENADWAQQSDVNRSRLSAGISLSGVSRPHVPLSLRNWKQQIEFWS